MTIQTLLELKPTRNLRIIPNKKREGQKGPKTGKQELRGWGRGEVLNWDGLRAGRGCDICRDDEQVLVSPTSETDHAACLFSFDYQQTEIRSISCPDLLVHSFMSVCFMLRLHVYNVWRCDRRCREKFAGGTQRHCLWSYRLVATLVWRESPRIHGSEEIQLGLHRTRMVKRSFRWYRDIRLNHILWVIRYFLLWYCPS